MEQQQLNQMVQRFPTPRLQTDDGNQEIAEMHAREDLLARTTTAGLIAPAVRCAFPSPARWRSLPKDGLPVAPEEQTRTIDGRGSGSGGDRAADRWICPDGLRAAVLGDPGAAADARRETGRAGRSGGETQLQLLALIRARLVVLLARDQAPRRLRISRSGVLTGSSDTIR